MNVFKCEHLFQHLCCLVMFALQFTIWMVYDRVSCQLCKLLPPAPHSPQVVVSHELHVFKVAACILELICIVLCLGCLGHDPTFRQGLFAEGVQVAAMSSLGLTVEHLASDVWQHTRSSTLQCQRATFRSAGDEHQKKIQCIKVLIHEENHPNLTQSSFTV